MVTAAQAYWLNRRRRRARNEGVGFSLDAFMADQAGGFVFDFTKTDRHFQDRTLLTLADDVGEAIGIALDGRTWQGLTYPAFIAAQPQLVQNGNFDANLDGWFSVNTVAQPEGQGTLSLVSNRLRNTANGVSLSRFATQLLSGLTVGDSVLISGLFNRQTQTWTSAQLRFRVTVGHAVTSVATNFAAGDVAFSDFSDPLQETAYYYNLISTSDTAALIADFDNISAKAVTGHAGRQATGTLKPLRQVEGAKFDGSDDNLLSSYLAAAGANFIVAKTTVPASLVATQVIAGASGASANRVFIGINTSGFACGGVGSDATTTIVGTTDLRNTEADIALTFDGTTVRLIVNGAVEYEAAQNSTPTTTIPYRIGALNNNGTAGSFYAGAVKALLVGREYLTVARFNQISNSLPA